DTLVVLEIMELLEQILWMLLCQFRIDDNSRIAIRTVTSCANSFKTGLTLNKIRLGWCFARREGRESGCCQCGSRQQRGEQLHIVGLVMCAKLPDSTMTP